MLFWSELSWRPSSSPSSPSRSAPSNAKYLPSSIIWLMSWFKLRFDFYSSSYESVSIFACLCISLLSWNLLLFAEFRYELRWPVFEEKVSQPITCGSIEMDALKEMMSSGSNVLLFLRLFLFNSKWSIRASQRLGTYQGSHEHYEVENSLTSSR